MLEDSSGSAEAVEHEVEHDADERIDERGYGEARGEPWLGVSEEQALNQHDDSLMQREERRGQCEARRGMLCVELAADGGSGEANKSFGDPVEAERSFSEQVL